MKKVIVSIEPKAYGRGILAGISKYSLTFGPWNLYTRQPFYYLSSDDRIEISDLIKRWGTDGMILREQSDINKYIDLEIPLILITYRKRKYPGIVCLEGGNTGAGKLAAEHFLERGFGHFAYCGIPGSYWSEGRGLDFQERIKDAGFDVNFYDVNSEFNWEKDQIKLTEWINSLPKPVGIMACTDERGRDILEICKMLNIGVPYEVAVVGVNNDELFCGLLNPPLSSVALNTKKAGYEIAEYLDRLMKKEKVDTEKVITVKATHVVTRQSTDVIAVDDDCIRDAINFIQKNIKKPLNVEDVAAHVAVSRRTLYDKFIQKLGLSVHEYIKNQRIELIERLLLKTNLSISKIATIMGYSDGHHIATYFRSVKGVNPHVFREENRVK